VSVGFHVVEDVRDFPVRADHKGCAGNPLHFLAIHVLLFDSVECFADFLVDVGKQGERQIVLVLKFLLSTRRIGGDA